MHPNEPVDEENVGVAFGLVIGSSAATLIGASIVFFPWLVKITNRKTLAAALAMSAGVMSYVSFMEIFPESIQHFQDEGFSEEKSYIFATLCFFGGVFLVSILNYFARFLVESEKHAMSMPLESTEVVENDNNSDENDRVDNIAQQPRQTPKDVTVSPLYPNLEDPSKDLEKIHEMALEMQSVGNDSVHSDTEEEEEEQKDTQRRNVENDIEMAARTTAANVKQQEEKKFLLMSLNTAIAITIHDFPEGLATFVAAMSDPKVGFVLAFAIAIHNIPEGICVALPVYYATGNRWKAFSWAMVACASSPFAALLGWAALAKTFGPIAYGILFGLVSGMMVIVAMKELLPTAHMYDKEDTFATYCFILGMAIMALSLVLFIL